MFAYCSQQSRNLNIYSKRTLKIFDLKGQVRSDKRNFGLTTSDLQPLSIDFYSPE
jgi:hypothetical protein